MKSISMAVVGCGDIAHIRYLYAISHRKEKFQIDAVYDRNPEVCQRTAKELGAQAENSLESLLAIAKIDTVIVTTYHPSHASIAIQCMEAGKNVIVEKPFATSSADAQKVLETAKRTGKLCMLMPYELYPIFRKAKKLISDGAIGRVTSCDAIFSHQGPLHAPWFFNKADAEWGVLADLGIYPLGILAYLVGRIQRVGGMVDCLIPERTALDGSHIHSTVEDSAAAVLSFENGCIGTMRSNWCTAADKNGSVYQATLYGTRGILYLNMLSHELVVYSPYQAVEGGQKLNYLGFEESYLVPTEDFDDHEPLMDSYYELHETGKLADDPDYLERQLNIIKVIEQIYRSSHDKVIETL